MKKIICIVLCLFMVISVFAGCAEKQLTFEEAAEAGKEFIKSEGLKDVKIVNETDGEKFTLDGKFDYINKKAVLSVSAETKDTVHTFKEMIKIDGKNLYVKIPDMSGLENFFGGSLFSEYEETDDYSDGEVFEDKEDTGDLLSGIDIPDDIGGLLEGVEGVENIGSLLEGLESMDGLEGLLEGLSGLNGEAEAGDGLDIQTIGELPGYGYGLTDDIVGKYIRITLPENKSETLKGIVSDAEDEVYEKAEKLEGEENYPYVVKYTQKDAYDLIISVLDGIKAKKNELSAEAAALISGYLGEENSKALEELNEKPLSEMISGEIDEFFNKFSPDDLAPDNAENFEFLQKIAYEKDKKLEYVFMYDLKDEENTHSVKTTITVTRAEADETFAEKSEVSDDEIFDFIEYTKNMLNTMKSLKSLREMFK